MRGSPGAQAGLCPGLREPLRPSTYKDLRPGSGGRDSPEETSQLSCDLSGRPKTRGPENSQCPLTPSSGAPASSLGRGTEFREPRPSGLAPCPSSPPATDSPLGLALFSETGRGVTAVSKDTVARGLWAPSPQLHTALLSPMWPKHPSPLRSQPSPGSRPLMLQGDRVTSPLPASQQASLPPCGTRTVLGAGTQATHHSPAE